MARLTFIDLFADASKLSEGFTRVGFDLISHVEVVKAASFILKIRAAYHYLITKGRVNEYRKYRKGELSKTELYTPIPKERLESVINLAIGIENISKIFSVMDRAPKGKK